MTIKYLNEYHDAGKARGIKSAEAVTRLVHDVVKPGSVVDVGCGHGYWLRAFMNLRARSVTGIDGDYIDRAKLEIPVDRFVEMDLNRPRPLANSFDLAMSIEVAEHLRPSSSDGFVDFLCSLSTCILFSAGIPGQPGRYHINARWPYFWSEKFGSRGYVALDFIRPRIWHDEDLMLCHRQNILLYVHRDLAGTAPYRDLPRMNCLTLVDYDVILQQLSARESLRRIVRKLLRREP
jgi:SAM-dependent methyltransferase